MITTKNIIEFFFSSALFINAILFIPQAVKIFRDKNASGVSISTFLGFFLIQFAIVLHAIIARDYLLLLGYLLSMCTCGAVVILTIFYGKTNHFSVVEKINFEELLEQIPGHVYWKNKEGVMLGCNTNNWKDFGLRSIDEYIGKTDYELFPDEQAKKITQVDQVVIQTGQSKVIEEETTTADGKVALYLSNKVALRDKYNKIIGILGVSLDITDARKIEIERLELLENIIALTPGHVYWKDIDGVMRGCNDLQARSAGFSSRQEMIGKTDYDMPWKEQADMLRKVDIEIMRTGIPQTVEEPSTLADGTEAIFLSNKVPLYLGGKILGILGISMDITERKRIEKELQETQNKLDGMTLVSSIIAHELRTPLAAFGVATENVKKIFPELKQTYVLAKQKGVAQGDVDTRYLDYVDEMLGSMDKEVRAAFTFIDISLMNTNPALDQGKPEIFSINEGVDEALARYPFNDEQRKLVQWQSNDKMKFMINGDKTLFIHVLFNLIKNALYYIAKAGNGNIQIWVEQGAGGNKLYFKDTGTGISRDILPKIFDRFFTRTYHGAGVGLTFCKTVMESLGGGITCESVEGEFTLFSLTFPGSIPTLRI